MNKTEALITQIIKAEGGKVSSMFFINKLTEMEGKGLLRVAFHGKSHYKYDFALNTSATKNDVKKTVNDV
ncbi:hypothetical protein [Neobacillus sp. NPDC093127]|uniref:hypothetical protein n=1 Tax=Neobacillus sp. NPDC093127 TaxID=3364296 RepID=UPI0037F2D603